ncbi:hypothetical protein ACF05T_31880 [Streptomyces lateritius]|uniref:Uncharacterized protein n=1 Tax=Streptomyces lateritius TaxID=67313 RepID=A0ABW6YL87_9ACTN
MTVGARPVCVSWHADDVARQEAAAVAARLQAQATAPPDPDDDHAQAPGKLRGLFRRGT